MNEFSPQNPGRNTSRGTTPWWEPYVFTGGVLIAFVAFFIACGILGHVLQRIPFAWALWLALFTVAGVIDFFRKPNTTPSATWPLLLSVFFGLAAFAYRTNPDRWFGVWHTLLAILFACLAIKCALTRYRLRKEQLARTDQAVETMRRGWP